MAVLECLLSIPIKELETAILSLTPEQAEALLWDWETWARPKQRPPEWDWRVWLIMAGRGFGKTRTGAEYIRQQASGGRSGHIALVGRTAADVRDVMVEGPSGILAVHPKWDRPNYEPSKRRLTWPNGAIATCYSAEEPDRLRGPNHDLAWADELASWKYMDTWIQLMFGLRIGDNPRCVVTTTPRCVVTTTPRPIKILRELLEAPTTAVVRGSTYENRENLAPAFFEEIIKQYEGSRLGAQEIYAEILDELEGALWNRDNLERNRVKEVPEMIRIVIAVDPAVTAGEGSAETGIVVAGLGVDREYYVLDDLSVKASPSTWASASVTAFHDWEADRIVGEVNNGGDLVEHTIRTVDRKVPYRAVRASRGKRRRAEPIAALYEQNRVHHVGMFAKLEDQMCNFTGEQEGEQLLDRMDALVWALTELSGGKPTPKVRPVPSLTRTSPWKIGR